MSDLCFIVLTDLTNRYNKTVQNIHSQNDLESRIMLSVRVSVSRSVLNRFEANFFDRERQGSREIPLQIPLYLN